MEVFLVCILFLTVISVLMNGLFITHELGWFPHGKYRGETNSEISLINRSEIRQEMAQETISTGFIEPNIFAIAIRKLANPVRFEYEDPSNTLQKFIELIESDDSQSLKEDLLIMVNEMLSSKNTNEELGPLEEKAIDILSHGLY